MLQKTQLYWDVKAALARLCPTTGLRRLPKSIIVEPTNVCNLTCPVCPTSLGMVRPRGFISLDLFRSIIDEFSGVPDKPRIEMNFAGEPLLHPEVARLVKYAHDKGHRTYISTNSTALTEARSVDLIDSGLDAIDLCLDGLTEEAHEAYRVGSEFEQVKENIERFIKIKHELGAGNPNCSIQTLLTSYSEKQIDGIVDWARDTRADSISLKSFSLGSHSSPDVRDRFAYLLPRDPMLRRKHSSTRRTLCYTMVNQAVIYWNGEIGLCCADYYGENILGNVADGGFIETILSRKVVGMRKLGFLRQYDICRTCPVADADLKRMVVDFSQERSESSL